MISNKCICKHCKNLKLIKQRGLCELCYRKREVRVRYPKLKRGDGPIDQTLKSAKVMRKCNGWCGKMFESDGLFTCSACSERRDRIVANESGIVVMRQHVRGKRIVKKKRVAS